MKISIFGKNLEIARGTETESNAMKNNYEDLQTSFDALSSTQNLNKGAGDGWNAMQSIRPNVDNPMVSTDSGAKIGVFPFPLHFLYQMAKNVDALRIPIDVLNREYHRNGFEVQPKFQFKCKKCKKEFMTKPLEAKDFISDRTEEEPKSAKPEDKKKPKPKPKVGKKKADDDSNETKDNLVCDVCDGKEFKEPNPKNRQILMNLIEKSQNNNHQTIKHISKQLARDLDITDMAYLVLLKQYKKTSDGVFRKSRLDEIIRMNPAQVNLIADFDGRLGYDDQGNEVFFCPEHRTNGRVQRGRTTMGLEMDKTKIPKCNLCGFECLKAGIEVNSTYQTTIANPKVIMYGLNEVIICHGKYWDDLMYGYSPIFTLWSKAMALSHMDEYIRKYFDKQRPPKGLLVIGSRNYQSLQKSFDNMKTEMKRDPYALNPLMVETERGGRNMVQYVDLTGSLQDLQFIDIRDEFRKTIGAMYGVMPFFSGDDASGGGGESEGMQTMVTNRAVQWGQEVLAESFFNPLAKRLGVFDWIIKLRTGEEQDDMRDEQLEAQKISNAQGMKSMGFRVEKDADGKFIFSQQPVEETSQDRMPQGDPSHNTEGMTEHEGETNPKKRPSDEGGAGGGAPASGPGTSQSNKGSTHNEGVRYV